MASLIGARVNRVEDPPLLRGERRFIDDIVVPDVLHAGFVRSPHPHAAIRGVAKDAALALPGVHAVLTLDDLAPVMAKRRMMRHSNSGTPLDRMWCFALADGEVSYVGEPVAIVIADSRYIAEDAAALVDVDYDLLPAVSDCRKAVAPGAPAVRRELNSNTVATYKVNFGDPDAAFAKAAHVFHTDLWQHRGAGHPIEGRGILAEFHRGTDGITVWASTQKAHDLFQIDHLAVRHRRVEAARDHARRSAAASARSSASIRKTSPWSRPRGCSSARSNGSRTAASTSPMRRRSATSTGRSTSRSSADAKVLGIRGNLVHDVGAFALQDVNIPFNSASMMSGPYIVPSLHMDVVVAATNKTPVSSIRGAGYPQAAFSMERMMDRVARELKLDRAEVRRRNLIPAEKMPYTKPLKARSGAAMQYDSGDYPESQAAVLKAAGWDDFPKRQAEALAQGRYIGIGLAHGIKGTGRGPFEFGIVRVSNTGKVTVFTGAANLGQGLRTVLAQIAASELGLRSEDITVVPGDTSGARARARRLRQPPDGHRRQFGAARVARGGREGEEAREPSARSRRARSRIEGRRGARGRRAAAVGQARRAVAHPQGRARLRLPARRRSRPRRQRELAHRRARLCQCLPRRRGRGRYRDRRGAHPQLRRAAGLRRADQSDAGRRPGAGRHRARHRQRAVRVDGLRRRRAAGDHDVRRLPAADRDRNPDT